MPSSTRSFLAILACLPLLAAVPVSGCRVADADSEVDSEINALAIPSELPWEMMSEQGEAVVPNIFYAEDSENEQVMPLAIDGHVMIRRMIYPTLGNPKLYDRSDAADSAMVALRLEDALVAPLHPREVGPEGHLTRVELDASDADGVRIMLVARSARDGATESTTPVAASAGVFPIVPQRILKNPTPSDMPEAFRRRSTYRFVFRKEQLANVPAGLYDVRLEVRQHGALAHLAGDREGAFEYQYNALRVFDRTPDDYPIISLTDTQISEGVLFSKSTETKMQEAIRFLGTTDLPDVRNAAFIVFNGDLHQAGAPAGFSRSFVATSYQKEMTFAIEQLKQLPVPIHMVPGNHDGYASVGHAPLDVDRTGITSLFTKSLAKVVDEAVRAQGPGTWPTFDFAAYDAWLTESGDKHAWGGYPRDIYGGSFRRSVGTTFGAAWRVVPRAERNFILYDGQYQWQKTIGPLYHSWRFKKSRFVGLNTYELRQHMRMSWGMYATNYGGGMSDVQLDWLDRELARGDQEGSDVVVVSHHDPRGGKGHGEHGTYHTQLGFDGIHQALFDGISRYTGVFTPSCTAPTASEEPASPPASDAEATDHDCEREGKQIWMAADPAFDCAAASKQGDGTCRPGGAPFESGPRMLERLARSKAARTFLIAHTHRNSYEMLQANDAMIPGRASAGHELLALELGSCAKITSMKFQGKPMYGLQILSMRPKADARSYALPQINEIKYLRNDGGGRFGVVVTMPVDRTVTMKRDDPKNPVTSVFVD